MPTRSRARVAPKLFEISRASSASSGRFPAMAMQGETAECRSAPVPLQGPIVVGLIHCHELIDVRRRDFWVLQRPFLRHGLALEGHDERLDGFRAMKARRVEDRVLAHPGLD